MRIAYVAAGAAGMYCGTCIRDNALASALIERGEDVVLIPTYTPIRTDENDVSLERVFFGGVNVYLQQKWPLFRHAPGFVSRMLDHSALLGSLGRFSGSTKAEDLGGLTLSMLEGDRGPHRKEMDKLIVYLRAFNPDVIQLTNSMFIGYARGLREAVGAPVVVAFAGEDIFLDGLLEPYRSDANALLKARGGEADAYTAPSHYYARHMADRLGILAERVDVVPLGINVEGYDRVERLSDETFRIGFLARICPEKGLHTLIGVLRILRAQNTRPVVLKVAGWLGKRDEVYFRTVQNEIKASGLEDWVSFQLDIDREEKIDFLCGLDVLSVPTPYREPKGLFVLEALAAGVPVVQPNHGSFPELIENTGGGVLTASDEPEDVAASIQSLMDDEDLRMKLGNQGRAAVRERYTAQEMADRTMDVYRRLVGQQAAV